MKPRGEAVRRHGPTAAVIFWVWVFCRGVAVTMFGSEDVGLALQNQAARFREIGRRLVGGGR